VLFETAGHITTPRFSPDGELIAFGNHAYPYDDRGSVTVVDRSGRARNLTREWPSINGIAWSPAGDEVWFAASEAGFARSVYAVTPAGHLRILLRAPGDLVLDDVSPTGRVVVAREDFRFGMLAGVAGGAKERDLTWFGGDFPVDVSSDGKVLLFYEASSAVGTEYAVCLRRTDGSPPVELGKGAAIALSPDGAWVLASLPSPEAPLLLLPTGPGTARQISLTGISHRNNGTFFPDGRSVLVEGYEAGHGARLYRVDLDDNSTRPVTPDGAFRGGGATFKISRDGEWVAIASSGAKSGISLYPIAGGAPRRLNVPTDPAFPIRWTTDGKAVLIMELGEPARIVRVDVITGDRVVVQELKPADPLAFPWFFAAIAADEKTYVYQYVRPLSELYLVEGLQ